MWSHGLTEINASTNAFLPGSSSQFSKSRGVGVEVGCTHGFSIIHVCTFKPVQVYVKLFIMVDCYFLQRAEHVCFGEMALGSIPLAGSFWG